MGKSHTETASWTVANLVSAITDNSNNKKVLIPKFQRNLVWRPHQKKAFIDSIKKGFPVGALLLFDAGARDNIVTYSLIDGLQRATTLKQYSEKPTSSLFFDDTNIDFKLLKDLKDAIDKENVELDQLSMTIVSWVTNLSGFQESEGFSSFDLVSHLDESLDLNMDMEKVKKLQRKMISFIKKIKDDADISSFNIPLLIYSGPDDNLPIIFERLNSKGTQLSKYQIYAAAWNDAPFGISNTKIIDKIQAKYESLITEGYEVDNYDSDTFNTSKFSCFEYIFGFGKLLTEDYPLLFSASSKEAQEDSIGFNIVNLCLGKAFSEMRTLPKDFSKYKIEDLETCILDAIDFVNNCLKTQLALKMNNKKTPPVIHTEMQIVSMIGKAFHSKYDENLKVRDSWKANGVKLKENLKFHYLFDILKESWKGSGDTKAYNAIHDDHYHKPVDRKQWESVFEDWLASDLQKRETKRITIKPQSTLFLKYIYVRVLPVEHQTSELTFDIEHLVPVDRLKKIALGEKEGLPISAFPNLCLLASELNRKKADKTFYEYYVNSVDNQEMTDEQANKQINSIEQYSFTTRNDLDFVKNGQSFNSETYEEFLTNRFRLLTEKFFDLYDIY